MDESRRRQLAAAVDRGVEHPSVKKLLGRDAQARAYFDGLMKVERALRGAGGLKHPPAPDAFVDGVLARLDGFTDAHDFNPLAAPFSDEPSAESSSRNTSEHNAMSQSNEQDQDDDLEGLAAMMRPSRTGSSASIPPAPVRTGPALTDDAMDESSGIVDIKHLAEVTRRASVVPAAPAVVTAFDLSKTEKAPAASAAEVPTPSEKSAEVKSGKPEAATAKASEAVVAKDAKAPAQAVPAASGAATQDAVERKGTHPGVWIAGIGIAAGVAFFAGRSGNNPAPNVATESPAPSSTSGESAPGTTGSAVSAAAPVAPAAPSASESAAAPAAPVQAAVAQPAPAAETAGQAPAAPTATVASASPTAEGAPPPSSGAALGSAAGASEGSRDGAGTRGAAPTTGAASATRGARRTESAPESAPSEAAPRAAAPARASAAPTPAAVAAPTARPAAAATSAGANPAAAPAPRATSVEELMRRATGQDRAEAATAQRVQAQAATAQALPPQLTRSMVQSAMGPFNGAVRACAQGQTGTATAVIQVSGEGAVTSVTVSSPWGSGPNGCITNRLQTARFPATQRPSSRVIYPFTVLASQPGG